MVELNANKNYLINEKGVVISRKTGKEMALEKTAKGYIRVTLTSNKVKRKHRVHRLVAEQFLPNPNNLPQVNHIDGDKTNNHINNLEWCTQSENIQHAYKTGLRKIQDLEKVRASRGVAISGSVSRLDRESIIDIYNNLSVREACDKYSISRYTYYDVKKLRYPYYKECVER